MFEEDLEVLMKVFLDKDICIFSRRERIFYWQIIFFWKYTNFAADVAQWSDLNALWALNLMISNQGSSHSCK